ncbi:RNA 3'-terminal phosphate cyclase [Candidatus Woesearchaeota archaeon]|nr:RNA 3'-terminal phosphate cyclase [Candidatus Woesearchaeota archaeon]
MIELDGSFGEGGGSVIRNALALSALTLKPFTVCDIRKNRDNPGLRAQHLKSVEACQRLCKAEVTGAELHSTRVEFTPRRLEAQTISVDIGTAGSITLLLQSLLLPAIFADSKVRFRIKGGTDTLKSMPFDYFTNVFLPKLKPYADVQAEAVQRGYYPKGGGRVDITINPRYKLCDYKDFEELWEVARARAAKLRIVETGKLKMIRGVSHASSLLENARVAERQAKAAKLALSKCNCLLDIKTEYSESLSPGSGITLWAEYNSGVILGADGLGERGKRAELVGKEAAVNLLGILDKAPVDAYLADQLILYLAMFGGNYRTTEITQHTLTNIYVAESFLGKIFEIDKEKKLISS